MRIRQFLKHARRVCGVCSLAAGAGCTRRRRAAGSQFSLAAALFLGGAVIFVVRGLSGGGGRARRTDLYAYGRISRASDTGMPFWLGVRRASR